MALPSVKQECPRESMSRRVAHVTCSDLPQLVDVTGEFDHQMQPGGHSVKLQAW
jgi:hypothetical protein